MRRSRSSCHSSCSYSDRRGSAECAAGAARGRLPRAGNPCREVPRAPTSTRVCGRGADRTRTAQPRRGGQRGRRYRPARSGEWRRGARCDSVLPWRAMRAFAGSGAAPADASARSRSARRVEEGRGGLVELLRYPPARRPGVRRTHRSPAAVSASRHSTDMRQANVSRGRPFRFAAIASSATCPRGRRSWWWAGACATAWSCSRSCPAAVGAMPTGCVGRRCTPARLCRPGSHRVRPSRGPDPT
jgi:hypothetical protein